MKISVLISMLLFSSAVFAKNCPNFAGEYELVSTTNKVRLNALQDKCKTFTMNYATATQDFGKVYILNNQRRQTYEDAELRVYETEKWEGTSIVAIVEDYFKASGKTTTAIVKMTLGADHNLSSENTYYDENNKVKQSRTLVYKHL